MFYFYRYSSKYIYTTIHRCLCLSTTPPADAPPAPTNTHSMITRSKNHIRKPQWHDDDGIWYPLLEQEQHLQHWSQPLTPRPQSQLTGEMPWIKNLLLYYKMVLGLWCLLHLIPILRAFVGSLKSKGRLMARLNITKHNL